MNKLTNMKRLSGMSSRQAQDYLDMEYRLGNIPYMKVRVVWKNGDPLVITADKSNFRVNVWVWYDEIINIDGIY